MARKKKDQVLRTCANAKCTKTFTSYRPQNRFCSPACRIEFHNAETRRRLNLGLPLITAGRASEFAGLSNESPHADAVSPGAWHWKHLKRGTTYTEITRAELQKAISRDLVEGDVLVIYRGHDGKDWARVEEEFEDGRFERVDESAEK